MASWTAHYLDELTFTGKSGVSQDNLQADLLAIFQLFLTDELADTIENKIKD